VKAFKHVLAATDLSKPSRHAVDRGFRIAQQQGARYTVLHALGLDAFGTLNEWMGGESVAVVRKIADHARAVLEGIVASPRRNLGIQPDVRLEPGTAASVIPEQVEALSADLVLLGAHGSGFVRRMLFGATASTILRKCKAPVLIVKSPRRRDYASVLVAVDFSPGSSRALQHALALAPDAHLTVIHVVDMPFENQLHYAGVSDDVIQHYRTDAQEKALRRLHDEARKAGLVSDQYVARALHGDATREILAQETACASDLIVMGKHGTRVTEELLLGSVANHVLAQSWADVLVVLDERRPETVG
jgi:nucleotide-binding universal stress UspA family protein